MKKINVISSLALGITTAITLGIPQSGLTATIQLQCSTIDKGFQISAPARDGQSQISLLSITDTSGIRQSCNQVSGRLQKAINNGRLESLMIVAHSIGRRDAICVVQSEKEGCRGDNLLLDVPRGRDRDEFLSEILTSVPTEMVSSGSEGQHTRRRRYSKFGAALARLPLAK